MKYSQLMIVACLYVTSMVAGPIADAIENNNQAELIRLAAAKTTEDGMTPLFLATITGSNDLVQALLATADGKESANEKTTNPDFDGWTVLHAAAVLDSLELLQMLWQAGARPQSGASELVENLIADENVKSAYMALLETASA